MRGRSSKKNKNGLEEDFKQFEGFLLPGEAVADTFTATETVFFGQIPAVVADHGLLVGKLRFKTQYLLCFLDGYEGIFGSSFVDPWVERGELERFEDFQGENDRACREGHDALAETGFIKDGLIILAHGSIFARTDVEIIIDLRYGQGYAGMDRMAEIFNVEKLIAVSAGANHREIFAFAGPLIEDGENAQPFRANK